ncbi:MAG TPA: L-threonylcarbamoyladenylate synthase [Anaerolineaceae bacterium]|nr:L-threonylcarbamoyladenylate synthase [Anaerolineaceae bacterium]
MNTKLIPITDPRALPAALQTLRQGGLVAFPTDTVYGLAALVRNPAAILQLFEAKGRDTTKAIAVLIGALDQLHQMTPGLPEPALRLARKFWPGALTLVVERHPDLPEILSPLPTIGIRMPDHPLALALLKASGPLATTSANRSGAANPLTAADVLDQLGSQIDLVLDGGPCPGGVPSTVVDCTGPSLKILRLGAIAEAAIREATLENLEF